MKWEVIKRAVGAGLRSQILTSCHMETLAVILQDLIASDFKIKSGLTRHEVITLYADKAHEVVMNWDVRCVGRLRDLFPQHFPPSLLKGKLVAYVADTPNGDWVVEKAG